MLSATGHTLERRRQLSFDDKTEGIPPPPRIPLSRHCSAPEAPRRSIFGSRATAPRRVRSTTYPELRQFAPPAEGCCLPEHFRPIEEEEHGADLPSPLQRFFKEGTWTTMGGAYPLTEPKSILRSSFNLTEAVRGAPKDVEESDDTGSTSSCTSSHSRHVAFDPRVTVTEYEDAVRRQWYSDYELERFQYETVALARAYLIAHPERIPEYQQPQRDPVTGAMRKKALYSLPAMQLPL